VITLSRWFAEPRGDAVVAFGREGERRAPDLSHDVAALAARLSAQGAAGRDWLLHCDDAYAFAVGLLALAHARARALLVPSRQPGALRELAKEAHGALCDGEPPDALGGLTCWDPLAASAADAPVSPLRALERDAPLAVLFTSGTTGAGRRVDKAVRHLEDEIAVLEERFGADLGPAARILATVAPQHLYGLLFRVLWPIASGRPFLRSAVLHPEELAPHADGGAPFAIVTTPVTLRHLAQRGAVSRGADCRAVFSSGGPLAADVAQRAAEVLGRAPFEVYGSTETGGVAVRQQHRGGEPWTLMRGVAAEIDPATGCLAIRSPFASGDDGGDRFVTGDRVELSDTGQFHLLGRADRVIKVGEKRLSLPDMEDRLRAHASVADVALLTLEKTAGEPRVAAVVVPSASAWDGVAADGRRALAKTLGEHLAAHFERVLLPRAWRFVAVLPSNAQGKVTQEALRALFASDAPADAPIVESTARSDDALELRVRIPWDLHFLDGHFPGAPVVPGVAQLHFAMRALEQLLGEPAVLRSLEALKFHDVLRPGQAVVLRVERTGAHRFAFALTDADHRDRCFSSGRGTLMQGRSPSVSASFAQRADGERRPSGGRARRPGKDAR
jgi:acyl-CoA synthetase (AMP-forming)/AMP-acid ligase II